MRKLALHDNSEGTLQSPRHHPPDTTDLVLLQGAASLPEPSMLAKHSQAKYMINSFTGACNEQFQVHKL